MWRGNEAVSLLRIACALLLALGCFGCDQLGNPKQFATGPSSWKDAQAHLITSTRSFTDEHTVRRLLSEELKDLDYRDPSIGPSETLTVVAVVPQGFRPTLSQQLQVLTLFKFEGRAPITRSWTAPRDERKWTAAFALPEPPADAVSSVAP
jgi:hypothetical protein